MDRTGRNEAAIAGEVEVAIAGEVEAAIAGEVEAAIAGEVEASRHSVNKTVRVRFIGNELN